MSGDFYRVRDQNTLENCIQFVQEQFKIQKDVEVQVKKYESRRSLSQNSLAWVIYDDVAKHMNKIMKPQDPYDKDDIHDYLLGQRFGFITKQVGKKTKVHRPAKKTSCMTVGQMTNWLDWVLAWCAEKGIDIKIPADCEYLQLKEAQEQ